MTAAARKRADLVLSGGGIKGVALVGAVGALIDARYGVQPRPARSSGR
jgi:NTE family protein